MLGWLLGVDEVSNPPDGRKLKAVQSVNGICSSVHIIISFFLAFCSFFLLLSFFLYCIPCMCCIKEKPVLDIKSKEWGKKELF